MKKPVLLAMFGYPGSGKTYSSERLAKKKGYVHLSSDKVRLSMFDKPKYTSAEHATVFRFMDYMALEFLRHGLSIVYDVNFNLRKHRKKLQKLARLANADYRLVWIQTE